MNYNIDQEDVKHQANSWLSLTKLGLDNANDQQFESGFKLNIAAYDDPEFAWTVIWRIICQYSADDLDSDQENEAKTVLSALGAGPLETLISQNSDILLARIIEHSTDARFKFCLSNVWQNQMPGEVWDVILRLTGRSMIGE